MCLIKKRAISELTLEDCYTLALMGYNITLSNDKILVRKVN